MKLNIYTLYECHRSFYKRKMKKWNSLFDCYLEGISALCLSLHQTGPRIMIGAVLALPVMSEVAVDHLILSRWNLTQQHLDQHTADEDFFFQ